MLPKQWRTWLKLKNQPYSHIVTSFLPNKDKDGKKFDVEPWETKALQIQGKLFGGATAYPGRGSYRRSDRAGKIVEEGILLEKTRPVQSFVMEEDFSLEALQEVSKFLHDFKATTNQESVALAVDGEMFYL